MRGKSSDRCIAARRLGLVCTLLLIVVTAATVFTAMAFQTLWRKRTQMAPFAQQHMMLRQTHGPGTVNKLTVRSTQPSCANQPLNYIVVVTYGRSGSTLLTGILGSVPGVTMRGENDDYLYGLFASHQNALNRIAHLQLKHNTSAVTTDKSHPFVGIEQYQSAAAIDQFRELFVCTVLNPPLDAHTIGFKEIRFGHHSDLHDYLNFIRQVLPGVRFVFNSRDHARVSKSGWWTADLSVNDTLATIQQRLDRERELYPQDSYQVHYDTYTKDSSVLRPLFDFLGLTFDEARIQAVLMSTFSVY
jgi:uncharacterized protein (DUF1499 family)